MPNVIHYPASGSHHDVTTTCGLNGWIWDMETDPPGTTGADYGKDERIYLCDSGHEDLVTCEACKVQADVVIARRKQYEAEVEAAGGLDAYNAALIQRLRAKLTAKKDANNA